MSTLLQHAQLTKQNYSKVVTFGRSSSCVRSVVELRSVGRLAMVLGSVGGGAVVGRRVGCGVRWVVLVVAVGRAGRGYGSCWSWLWVVVIIAAAMRVVRTKKIFKNFKKTSPAAAVVACIVETPR